MWKRFDEREHATVLAALRYWQREGLNSDGAEGDIATDGGTLSMMQPDEIDKLCERLNSSDATAKPEYIEAARQLYANPSDDDIEVDDDAASSRDEAEDAFGTWVMGWLFVRDKEATGEVGAEDDQEGTTR